MDAPTIVSLSTACGLAVPEALLEEMRQRELERMRRHDLESYVAQKHYTHNLQVTPHIQPQTWRASFWRAWVLLWRVHRLVLDAARHLRFRNQPEEAYTLLVQAEYLADWVWSDEEAGEEDLEVGAEDDDL